MNVGMKTLNLHDSYYCYSSSCLEVYAPYIVSFELLTTMSRKNLVIKRMQSLESASFYCLQLHCWRYADDEGYTIVKILEVVCQLKDLRLCSCYTGAFSTTEEQSLDYLSFDVTCLRIKTDLAKWEIPGIAYMLRHSPNIVTLIISIDNIMGKEFQKDGECCKLQRPNITYQLWNLKTVKVYNFMKNLNQPLESLESTAEELLEMLQNCMNILKFLLKKLKGVGENDHYKL